MKVNSIDVSISDEEYNILNSLRIGPCPFCFTPVPTINNIGWCFGERDMGEDWSETVAVTCLKCGSQGPMKESRELAISGWNAEDVGPNTYK